MIDTGSHRNFWGTNYGASNDLGVPKWRRFENMTLQTHSTVPIQQVTGVCKCTTMNRVKRSLLTTRGGGSNIDDLGIGSNPDQEEDPDWTFASNAAEIYPEKYDCSRALRSYTIRFDAYNRRS